MGNIFEAMKEVVPVYNVKLDVGNSNAISDVFVWFNKPGLPPEDRSMLIEDILYQLKYKMNRLPPEALRLLLEFMLEVKDKMYEIMSDLQHRETKVATSVIMDIQEKDRQISDAIGRLRAKVGNVERTGRFQLVGGVAPGNYSIPDPELSSGENHKVTANQLLEMMQEEMQPAK